MTVKRQTTKDLITDSLVDLATQGENVRTMSVRNIVDNCGVSKRTFYYHFTDKYDVIAWSFVRRYKPLFVEHMDREDYHGMLVMSLAYLKEERLYYENLFKNTDGFDAVVNTLATCTLDIYEEYYAAKYGDDALTGHIRFCLRFSCIACLDAMASWLFGGMKQDLEELATWMEDCLPQDLRPFLMPARFGPAAPGCEPQAGNPSPR